MNKKIDDLTIEIRREYYRKWRAANKDKVRQHNANYWRKQAERQLKQEAKRQEVDTDGKQG